MRNLPDVEPRLPPTSARDVEDSDYGISRDPATVERGLVGIFREIFDNEEIGPEDDFFAQGGDSLLVVRLMSAVEREFASIIPGSVLLEAPTPRLLTQRVIDDLNFVPPANLVPVRAEGIGSPIFCIHGMDGDALFCRKLASVVEESRPIYGLRASGLRSDEIPDTSVPVIAAKYISEIRGVQTEGPYLILGQCGTSVIALEMARQLLAGGEAVSGLILVDPAVSEYVPWLSVSGMHLTLLQTRAMKRGQKTQEAAYDDRDLTGADRRKMVKRALSGAVGSYAPAPIDADGLIICSTSRVKKLLNSVRGYPALIKRLEAREITAEHAELFSDFYKGRIGKLGETAKCINEFLARVSPIPSAAS